ncbi:HU family DNA-binding protein, partial [Streptomyces sp. BE20]|uniref:HU family DNA-binding protein n=1 Tax=Streptomyces sp. BE20 TaxID=3002525 RepID=UPI002E7819C3
VSVTRFCTIYNVERNPRIARKPQNREKVNVNNNKVPPLRTRQGVKDLVSGSKKQTKEGPSVKN